MKRDGFRLLVLFALFALGMFLVSCGEDSKVASNAAEVLVEDIEVGTKANVDIDYIVMNGVIDKVEFTTDDEDIAIVDANGCVTGVSEGETIVTLYAYFNDGSIVEKYINVNVIYNETFKIQFQLAGGKCDVTYADVVAGGSYTLPTPTKENAEFLGWSMTGVTGYITRLTNVTKNMVVKANWLNSYTIKYELNGGSALDGTVLEDVRVKEGTSLKLPDMQKEGNTFLGWSLSKTGVSYMTEIAKVNANCTVYAIFKPAQIEVSFDLDGGFYNGPKYLTYDGTLKLTKAQKANYEFLGWSLEKGSTSYVTELTNVKNAVKLYANFQENASSQECIFTNLPENGLPYASELQLEWTFYGTLKKVVEFSSSNVQVLTVDENGLVKAIKPGIVTIKVEVKGNTNLSQTIEIEVYKPGRFDVSYDTVSYVTVGGEIKLNAKYYNKDDSLAPIAYKSQDTKKATVDGFGVVKGLQTGSTTIRAFVANNEDIYFDFLVTIVSSNMSDGLKLVLDSHESNIFIREDLSIAWAYTTDIIGSVSDLYYNYQYSVNRDYEELAAKNSPIIGTKKSTEFVCVHYTGNANKNTNALMHAKYFANGSGGAGTSIHYTTGNDGIYHCSDDKLAAVHAGDGGDLDAFYWRPTGVKVKENDPTYPKFGVSANSKFTINGEETTVSIPARSDGLKVTGDTYTYQGKTYDAINDMGLAFKIVDGEYYMGTTWWSGSGFIVNKGGNANSIGIESAVDKGSDIWKTWHITAQLVAHLLVENNLDTTRVVGHYFFSGKICPQPMLENDLECWYKFMEMVRSEYTKITTCKDYDFSFSLVGGGSNPDDVRATRDTYSKLITYQVRITKGTKTEVVELGSIIEGEATND